MTSLRAFHIAGRQAADGHTQRDKPPEMANANAGCNISLSQFCGLSLSASGLSSPTFRATMLRADGQQHSLRCSYLPLRYQNTTIRVHLLEQDALCLKSSGAPWNSSHICGHIPNSYQVQTKAHFQTAMIWMLLLASVPGSTVSQHKTKGELLRLARFPPGILTAAVLQPATKAAPVAYPKLGG